jgi:hypothetical protein
MGLTIDKNAQPINGIVFLVDSQVTLELRMPNGVIHFVSMFF